MRPVIYCYIEPFIINQNIYISNDATEEPKLAEKVTLDSLVPFLAYNAKDYNIHLHSSSKNLTTGYADEIREYAMREYNLNNINIEVE